ncbi:hypothetical protein QUF56_17375 [Ureibacillus composti]|nr:hypothetical protein [Ureibacillus composti]
MRKSARMIAKELGLKTEDVYSILKELGFLVGEKGNWFLTELGKQAGGVERLVDNGERGRFNVSYQTLSWDEKIFDIIDNRLKKK